jgi:predicted ATPase
LILEIEEKVRNSEENVRSKLDGKNKILLKQRLQRIIENFRIKKSTLPNCVAQISSVIDVYIEESKFFFEDDSKKDKFSKEIHSIKEDLFGLNENYEELLQRIQPSLSQVIELLNENSNISIAFFAEINDVINDRESSLSTRA